MCRSCRCTHGRRFAHRGQARPEEEPFDARLIGREGMDVKAWPEGMA